MELTINLTVNSQSMSYRGLRALRSSSIVIDENKFDETSAASIALSPAVCGSALLNRVAGLLAKNACLSRNSSSMPFASFR